MSKLFILLIPACLWGQAFPPSATEADVPRLMEDTKWVRSLDEAELVRLVPERSGLYFVGCPNCSLGKQEDQLAWSDARPMGVHCKYCGHQYPSVKYPMNDAVVVTSPSGAKQRYPFWADAKGYRYFFQARRDDLVRAYLAARASQLAQLYAVTRDRSFARRSAMILDRFAEVFPSWCYHYDYPFQQKVIYDGNVTPAQFRPGYRTARWNWWAYKDIPDPLVEAYDWIRPSGVLDELAREKGVNVTQRIEQDLFRNAADQVMANPESYHNMSPFAWISLIRLGRVIGEPRYVHEPVRRLRHFMETRFLYDAVWPEGSPSYHAQTVGGLSGVIRIAKGYSDPASYRDAEDGTRFDDLDLDKSFPLLQQSSAALMKMRFPDGRFVPVHDAWSTDRRAPLDQTAPYLLPALGHACLGSGRGSAQMQFHLTWSGGYGHQHADNLGLLVFASGREALSDIGYTHTRHRAWTLSSAAHNTVVIDGRSQTMGSQSAPTDGNLLWFDVSASGQQVVSVDGARAYPGVATLFRRTLIVRDAGNNRRYAIDIFEVAGGRTHDYFLHGDADGPSAVNAALPLRPLDTLLPAGFEWRPGRNEGEVGLASQQWWAYGHLRGLRSAPVQEDVSVAVTFRSSPDSGLRVTLVPQPGSRLVLGENPAVRGAKEDDGKLDEYSRPFMMLRRQAEGEPSTFVSVIEPFEGEPFIQSVERVASRAGTVALRVVAAGRSELIRYDPKAPLTPRSVQRATLETIEGNFLVLADAAAHEPTGGEVVRLVTADGWVYPFTAASFEHTSKNLKIRVAEGPGMSFDPAAKRLKLTVFPQREHSGPVAVEWMAR